MQTALATDKLSAFSKKEDMFKNKETVLFVSRHGDM